MNSTRPSLENPPDSARLIQPPIGAPKDKQADFFQPQPLDFLEDISAGALQIDGKKETFPFTDQDLIRHRNEAIDLAVDWSKAFVPDAALKEALRFRLKGEPGSRVLFAGHQPELFHPGVWFKNFVLSKLAKRFQAVSINLIVDNDLAKTNSLAVPVTSGGRLDSDRVLFDMGGVGIPFEEKNWNYPATFAKLCRNIQEKLTQFSRSNLDQSILALFLEKFRLVRDRSNKLHHLFAMSRQLMEIDAGVFNLELPISRLCQGNGFRDFFKQVLFRASDFFRIHNQVLHKYRQVNGLKSSGRPVADLEEFEGDENWIELPFWIWSEKNPTRRRLFCANVGNETVLSDQPSLLGGEFCFRIREDKFESAWDSIRISGAKIRTRALTTTMYARLFLCDGFVHGIGGAIYDRVTDEIARRFFGRIPAPFLASTATRWLPFLKEAPEEPDENEMELDHYSLSKQHITDLKQRLRGVRFQPERFLKPDQKKDLNKVIADKEGLLARIPRRGQKQEWQAEIQSINNRLSAPFKQEERCLKKQLKNIELEFDNKRWVENREWSFLLFSQELLAQFRNWDLEKDD